MASSQEPTFRRSHKKSRNGCQLCKQRRVKCDEVLPSCSYCAKRGAACVYPSACRRIKRAEQKHAKTQQSATRSSEVHAVIEASLSPQSDQSLPDGRGLKNQATNSAISASGPPASSSEVHLFSVERPSDVELSDLYLMHHYSTETYKTFRSTDILRSVWQSAVPKLSLNTPYLLRSLLASAALHLAHLRPERRKSYLAIASSHQDAAVALFREKSPSSTKLDGSALYILSSMTLMYEFGSPKVAGSLCIVDAEALTSNWLGLLRSFIAMLGASDYLESILRSPIRDLVTFGEAMSAGQEPRDSSQVIGDYLSKLSLLLCNEGGITSSQDEALHIQAKPSQYLETLRRTFAELEHVFRAVFSLKAGNCCFGAVFCWPAMVSQAYIDLVAGKDPLALIILAHYCILLHHIDTWWMEGWPDHILVSIEANLDPAWKHWLRRPIQIVRTPDLNYS